MSDAVEATIWVAVFVVSVGCLLLLAERAAKRGLAAWHERADLRGLTRTDPGLRPPGRLSGWPRRASAPTRPPGPLPDSQAAGPSPGVRRPGPMSVDAADPLPVASTDTHPAAREGGA